jgi:hypothetical protein
MPQSKVMLAALDPVGCLIGRRWVAGTVTDDGLYVPNIDWLLEQLDTRGLLFIGDSKRSGLATRADVSGRGHAYLMPQAQFGQVLEQLAAWVAKATGDSRLRTDPGQARLGHQHDPQTTALGGGGTGLRADWLVERDC